MLLPNRERAYVPAEKLRGYLLSESHAVGRAKARFFLAHGYTATAPDQFAEDLLRLARDSEIEREVASSHGTKYVISGTLKTPTGTTVAVRTVWIVEPDDDRPRLVTAYPE